MTKYASNALLAALVSFSNEFAALCEATPGTDVEEVLNGLHLDRRLSPMHQGERVTPGILAYLRAGCGFGGSCLPKDVSALRDFARKQGVAPRLLDAVSAVNAGASGAIGGAGGRCHGTLRGADVAVLGLAFKAGTDDLRDSPALAVIRLLEEKGAVVRAYDPLITRLDGLRVCASAKEALTGADAAIVVTAWPEFAAFDWTALSAIMRRPILIDGRNALRGAVIPESSTCVPIGRHFEPQGVAVGLTTTGTAEPHPPAGARVSRCRPPAETVRAGKEPRQLFRPRLRRAGNGQPGRRLARFLAHARSLRRAARNAHAGFFGCARLRAGELGILGQPAHGGDHLLAGARSALGETDKPRLQPGDEVITPAVTFPTTLTPIVQNRLVPVFVDCEVGTYNINPRLLEAAIGPRTRAILLPHTLGLANAMDVVTEIARRHNLWLLEDSCDALGATFDGKLVGTFGDMAR